MKHFALLMAVVMLFNSLAASQSLQPEASSAAKVKAEVQKRGIGERSRVRVSLRNRTGVQGYISKIEDATFDVTAKNSGRAMTIAYADVQKIQGAGMSTGAKIAIVGGIAVAVTVVAFAIAFKSHGY